MLKWCSGDVVGLWVVLVWCSQHQCMVLEAWEGCIILETVVVVAAAAYCC